MHYIKKKESVNVEVDILFGLVNKVDKYSNFLPWCPNSRIISDVDNTIIGEIHVSKNLVNWKFSTKNSYIKNKEINLELIDGPFSHLKGYWSFLKVDKNNTLVELFLEYSFSSKVIEFSMKPVFSSIMSSILDSFISEAFRIKHEK
ncbi:MAG: type II toxin-antitoxin system RatA family toxin [Pseudomonadota bacterium]|nr:type II toxin-antitoxin system RatA family toxin [Pseudomonadota bacterium]